LSVETKITARVQSYRTTKFIYSTLLMLNVVTEDLILKESNCIYYA